MQMGRQPKVIVIAGPNGAGKTTSAGRLLPVLGVRHFVNADAIAVGLSAFDPESVAIVAGRLMLQRIDELAAARENFAFETTLSARSFAPMLRALAADGYSVRILFVCVRDAELAISRVADRVRRGGHHIPDEVVRRRYTGGLRNFFALYLPVAGGWRFYDNSSDRPIIVARSRRDGSAGVVRPDLWAEYRRKAGLP